MIESKNAENLTEAQEMEVNGCREEFRKLFEMVTAGREGAAELLAWLDTTDFYTAPASTKYHMAMPGGLCRHSVNVASEAMEQCRAYGRPWLANSAGVAGLLHDVCKIWTYTRTGDPERPYKHKRQLPIGHGEKSLYMIASHGFQLTDEEACAIRWHMGLYRDRDAIQEMDEAQKTYKLTVILHAADMAATWLLEDVDDMVEGGVPQ